MVTDNYLTGIIKIILLMYFDVNRQLLKCKVGIYLHYRFLNSHEKKPARKDQLSNLKFF